MSQCFESGLGGAPPSARSCSGKVGPPSSRARPQSITPQDDGVSKEITPQDHVVTTETALHHDGIAKQVTVKDNGIATEAMMKDDGIAKQTTTKDDEIVKQTVLQVSSEDKEKRFLQIPAKDPSLQPAQLTESEQQLLTVPRVETQAAPGDQSMALKLQQDQPKSDKEILDCASAHQPASTQDSTQSPASQPVLAPSPNAVTKAVKSTSDDSTDSKNTQSVKLSADESTNAKEGKHRMEIPKIYLLQKPILPLVTAPPSAPPLVAKNLVTFGQNVQVGDVENGAIPLVTPRGTEWIPSKKLPSLGENDFLLIDGGMQKANQNKPAPGVISGGRRIMLPPPPGPPPASAKVFCNQNTNVSNVA